VTAETLRFFDIQGAAAYAVSIGLSGVTPYTIRAAIHSGRLPYIKEGKKFYVSRSSIDSWLAKAEKRVRS
jgi:excisionase family DNA binding protein